MRRPGILGDWYTPKKRRNYGGLGSFGKGKMIMAPPPAPPPIAADWTGAEWSCSNQDKPASDAEHYYHCCPDGWTKTKFGETNPCRLADQGIFECGPRPEGSIEENMQCSRGEWVDVTLPSALPVGPLSPRDILAPELEFRQEPLLKPGVIAVIGGGVALLFIVTIILKMRS